MTTNDVANVAQEFMRVIHTIRTKCLLSNGTYLVTEDLSTEALVDATLRRKDQELDERDQKIAALEAKLLDKQEKPGTVTYFGTTLEVFNEAMGELRAFLEDNFHHDYYIRNAHEPFRTVRLALSKLDYFVQQGKADDAGRRANTRPVNTVLMVKLRSLLTANGEVRTNDEIITTAMRVIEEHASCTNPSGSWTKVPTQSVAELHSLLMSDDLGPLDKWELPTTQSIDNADIMAQALLVLRKVAKNLREGYGPPSSNDESAYTYLQRFRDRVVEGSNKDAVETVMRLIINKQTQALCTCGHAKFKHHINVDSGQGHLDKCNGTTDNHERCGCQMFIDPTDSTIPEELRK